MHFYIQSLFILVPLILATSQASVKFEKKIWYFIKSWDLAKFKKHPVVKNNKRELPYIFSQICLFGRT